MRALLIFAEPPKQTCNDVMWLNRIFGWILVTSNESIPHFVDAWLQDLNEALATQKVRQSLLF